MSTPYPIRLAGEELWLLPEKAIYWPAQQALLVADVHFGKAAAYRRLGQPVPQGTTTQNVSLLDALVARLPCRQLIFLGDFLHGPGSHAPATLAALAQWRARHVDLPMTLIRGRSSSTSGRMKSMLMGFTLPWSPSALNRQGESLNHHESSGKRKR